MVQIGVDLAGKPPTPPLGVGLLLDGLPLHLTAGAAAEYVSKCRVVLRSLGTEEPMLRLKLMTGQLLASADTSVGLDTELTEPIAALAEDIGTELARAYAFAAWCIASQAPEHTNARVEKAQEILDIAELNHDDALTPLGYSILLTGLLEQGEIRSLDIELMNRRNARLTTDQSFGSDPVDWFQSLRLILDGDMKLAEDRADAMLAMDHPESKNIKALYITQIGMVRWMQGRIEGAEEHFLAARREYPEQLFWPASLAWLWLAQGRRDSAEVIVRSLPPPSELPRDRYWLPTTVVLAEIARVAGSREDVEELRAQLLSFEDRLVPVGVGVAFWGTVARTLGLLEERLGMLDEAQRHLELAVEMSARIGALAWHCEAQIELAEFAIRHELPDVRAYELLAEARLTSTARGFAGLNRRAMHQPQILVLGRFEVTSLCGTRAEWTSRKARELVKMLVCDRGVARSREQYMDVLWPGESPDSLGNRFSVAVSVVRRALDPQRLLPTQHFVVTEGDSIRLNINALTIDLERFLKLAVRPDQVSRDIAKQIYHGEAFSDEPYADWSESIRNHLAHLRNELDEPPLAV